VASKQNAQRFIARNKKPRVQIEYETFVGNAKKKVELPFVMGVMSDLSGDAEQPLPPVAERKFTEFDAETFNDKMKSMKPRVAITVPNKLTGEGNLAVDITFEKMEDFSPAAVARKVGALNELLEARTQLANLITFIDGRTAAEDLIADLLKDPALLKALAQKAKPADPPPPDNAPKT
jgi:type VI secretion system protein ImpB